MSFRPLRRIKKAIPDECAMELLQNEKRAVLAVNGDDGYPYAVPVNYFYDRNEGKIFFHGARAGHKSDSLRRCDKVCLTVYGNEQKVDGDWAPTLQSTVVFGRCKVLENPDEKLARLRQLAMKYYPSETEMEEEILSSGKAVQMYEITIEHLCGKQIQEK